MESREDIERRLADLEHEVQSLRASRRLRSIRKQASWELAGLPFYDIALGPDFAKGERRGHARGFIAIGDIATGIFALGGFARGLVAVGGAAIGVITLGGCSLGLGAAIGGLAIGGVAVGGAAIGGVAVGGGALGYYACGGGAAGAYVISAVRHDPEAVAFFRWLGQAILSRF
jgi:hypothetical protein